MRIAIAQIDSCLGDFRGNSRKILDYTQRAADKRANLVVFPELSLFGYPPNDLLERPEVIQNQLKELKSLTTSLQKICRKYKTLSVAFGALTLNSFSKKKGGKPFLNCAVVVKPSGKPEFFEKQLLPTYDVFDEARFFAPGSKTGVTRIPGCGRVAVTVCEDMWAELKVGGHPIYDFDPLARLGHLDLVINLSASPFTLAKEASRLKLAKQHAKRTKAPFVYVNCVGAQDEIIFDGASFALDKSGRVFSRASLFSEDLILLDFKTERTEHRPTEMSDTERLRSALVLGIREFARKTGHRAVHLGLSGGVDSALVAALAVDALGPSSVTGILMPGPFSSEGSVTDALALAKNLGIKTFEIGINDAFGVAVKSLAPIYRSEKAGDLVAQNIQARLRGMFLMAFANQNRSLLLNTGNKSELAAGYNTLYGDLCGGLAPIGDLTKRDVYALARLYNEHREIIPQNTIDKAPSAELAPGQRDQDTLPPYEELDDAVESLVEQRRTARTKTEKWLLGAMVKSEFKRWQAPPVLKVTEHAFGRGRRMPIAAKLEEQF